MNLVEVEQLQRLLADQFVTFFRFSKLPAGQVADRQLLVVQPEPSLASVYRTVADVQEPLAVTTPALLTFWLRCDPVLAFQLAHGEHWGEMLLPLPPAAPLPAEQLARWAHELLFASQALFDDSARPQLEQLAVQVGLQPATTTAATLAQLYRFLEHWPPLPVDAADNAPLRDAPAALPQLRAVYEEIDTGLLVLPDRPQLFTEIDWAAVSRAFQPRFRRLLLTSVNCFQLLARYEMPLSFAIGRFRHDWGDALINPEYPVPALLRDGARGVLRTLCQEVPRGLATADDLDALAHDIQNRLLKFQFQYELLSMIVDVGSQRAPRLHLDRSLPAGARIEQLVDHLQAWVALYQSLLNEGAWR